MEMELRCRVLIGANLIPLFRKVDSLA